MIKQKQPFKWGSIKDVLWEISQNLQENTCAGISFLKLGAVDLQLHLEQDFSTGSFREFCEISKNTVFAEHHRTTASDYSNINSSEGGIGKQNYKLWHKN